MNVERIQQILHAALQLEESKRDQFVVASCAGDADLEAEVRSLLEQPHDVDSAASTQRDSKPVQPGSAYAKGDRLEGGTGFVILRLISAGGFGEVYEAEEVGDVTRRVVIKILKEQHCGSQEIIRRFESERQFIARVTHPNVVKLVGYGTSADGRPYYAMEHVGGVPLLKYCTKERLPFEKRLRLFIEVCKGLQAIHNAGILHLDIKPNNILVSEDDHGSYGTGRCTIIDFGIAVQNSRTATDSWRTSDQRTRWGTYGYMSPEIMDGDHNAVDQRSDIWSMGVLLTELMTGQNPTSDIRDASSLRSSVREHQADLTSALKSLDDNDASSLASQYRTTTKQLRKLLCPELSAISRQAMSEQRDGRYRSADAMREDAVAILNQAPVKAYSTSGLYRARKWAARRPWAAVSVLTVTIAASLLLALTILLNHSRTTLEQTNSKLEIQRDKEERLKDELNYKKIEVEKSLEVEKLRGEQLQRSEQKVKRSLEANQAIVDRLDPGQLAKEIQRSQRSTSQEGVAVVGPDEVRDALVRTVFEPIYQAGVEDQDIDTLMLISSRLREMSEYDQALKSLDAVERLITEDPDGDHEAQKARLNLERGLVYKETDPVEAINPLRRAKAQFEHLQEGSASVVDPEHQSQMWRAQANLAFVLQKTRLSQDEAIRLAQDIPEDDDAAHVPQDALMHKHTVLANNPLDAAGVFSAKETHHRRAVMYAQKSYGSGSREHLRKQVNLATALGKKEVIQIELPFHPKMTLPSPDPKFAEALGLIMQAHEQAKNSLGELDDDYPWFATQTANVLWTVRQDPNPPNAEDSESPLKLMSSKQWDVTRDIPLIDMAVFFGMRHQLLVDAREESKATRMWDQFDDRLRGTPENDKSRRTAGAILYNTAPEDQRESAKKQLLDLYEEALQDAKTTKDKFFILEERRGFFAQDAQNQLSDLKEDVSQDADTTNEEAVLLEVRRKFFIDNEMAALWKRDAEACIELSSQIRERSPVDHALLLLEISDRATKLGDVSDWSDAHRKEAFSLLQDQLERLSTKTTEQDTLDRLGILLLLSVEYEDIELQSTALDQAIELTDSMGDELQWISLQLRCIKWAQQSESEFDALAVEEGKALHQELTVLLEELPADSKMYNPWLGFDIQVLAYQISLELDLGTRPDDLREIARNVLYDQTDPDAALEQDLEWRLALVYEPMAIEQALTEMTEIHGEDHRLVSVLRTLLERVKESQQTNEAQTSSEDAGASPDLVAPN